MTGSAVLRAGDEVRFAGQVHTVVALSGSSVRLVDAAGAASVVLLGHLLSDPTFALVAGQRAPLPPLATLEGLPAAAIEHARWWECHIIELLTGLLPTVGPDGTPKPEYDPSIKTVRQRELAKVEELAGSGHSVGLATVQRFRLAYEREGLWGLVDRRAAPRRSATGRVDPRIVEIAQEAIRAETDRSTGTVSRLRRQVERLVADRYGDDAPAMPTERTFYRLVKRLSMGRHTFGSARTRRSLAKQPDGPFGTVTAVRPGEWMQIDSTPLDVRVVLDDGLVDRVELTALVDLATRTIGAAVLRPTTKAVDASLLLARTLTPEPMRPGWSDALRMTRSVLPHRSLTELDERLENAAARPVIAPETIVCDHGKAYLSATFRSACRSLGVNLQPAHPDTPTDKPVVERTLQSVGTLFCQDIPGYVGSSVERRGKDADQQAVWSMVELQALLDEWIVTVWQNRPHEGLRDPISPDKPLTPNEKYAALVGVAGYVPIPLSANDYIELLPVTWRTINSYGVKINHRTYDAKALNPHRRQHSGVEARQGRWEIHYDPYDVSRIWVRDHYGEGWIAATWTHLRTAPVPFGDAAWQHARDQLAHRGEDRVTEAEIAQVAAALVDRAARGPDTSQDAAATKTRRVAGRTRAIADSAWPKPEPDQDTADDRADGRVTDGWDDVENDESWADVVPLPLFDARKEAEKWRF